MKKKIIAFIPARGGSKGIPGKNIIDLGGKPLIAWTIESAKNSPYISEVVVSSDDPKILEVADKYGARSLLRPVEFSRDESPTGEAIQHFIQTLKLPEETIIALLQPTSPFRKTSHLNAAVEDFEKFPMETLISVSEFEVSPYRGFSLGKNDGLKSLFSTEYLYKRRQDFEKTVAANGAIYLFSVRGFLQEKSIPMTDLRGYVMHAPFDLDIDTQLDLEFARFLINSPSFATLSTNK